MSDLISLGLKEAAAKIKAREISSTELTKALLERAESRNPSINAFITLTGDKALAMAAESDARVKNGKARLIEGVPLGIKDLFCTKDILTTAASHILDGFKPGYESTVTSNLWQAGGVLMGKLNLDEFAMGSTNETSHYGTVNNPWDLARTSGGSSGGSAAAVADFQCPAATGTDTGGSIRQPAAFSGVVGIKPTYGRGSRWGIVAFASSLDQAGAFGRTVADAALMLRAMAGFDEKDSTSMDVPMESFDEDLDNLNLKGLKIGLPKEYFTEGLDPRIQSHINLAVKRFEEQGALIKEVSLPHTEYAAPTYYILAPAEAASNLSRYDGMRYGLRVDGANLMETYCKTRAVGFGDEVKRRIMIGNYTLSSGYYDAYYSKAQQVRTLIREDFKKAFTEVDVLFTPTAPTPAFKTGAVQDPVQMYLNDVFTIPSSLAGLPGISVPAGTVEEDGTQLPIGLQIIGQPFAERQLLRVAHAHEKMCGFQPLGAQ